MDAGVKLVPVELCFTTEGVRAYVAGRSEPLAEETLHDVLRRVHMLEAEGDLGHDGTVPTGRPSHAGMMALVRCSPEYADGALGEGFARRWRQLSDVAREQGVWPDTAKAFCKKGFVRSIRHGRSTLVHADDAALLGHRHGGVEGCISREDARRLLGIDDGRLDDLVRQRRVRLDAATGGPLARDVRHIAGRDCRSPMDLTYNELETVCGISNYVADRLCAGGLLERYESESGRRYVTCESVQALLLRLGCDTDAAPLDLRTMPGATLTGRGCVSLRSVERALRGTAPQSHVRASRARQLLGCAQSALDTLAAEGRVGTMEDGAGTYYRRIDLQGLRRRGTLSVLDLSREELTDLCGLSPAARHALLADGTLAHYMSHSRMYVGHDELMGLMARLGADPVDGIDLRKVPGVRLGTDGHVTAEWVYGRLAARLAEGGTHEDAARAAAGLGMTERQLLAACEREEVAVTVLGRHRLVPAEFAGRMRAERAMAV